MSPQPVLSLVKSAPQPCDEEQRLADLIGYGILDTPPDPRFDRLTALARLQFQVPIALVSLVDSDRQWFKSHDGLAMTETPREAAFCAHTILGRDPFIVRDAREHPLFQRTALVAGAPCIRFYAGVPLISKAGHALGSFCILDRVPREIGAADLTALHMLGEVAVDMLELHRSERSMAASIARQHAANQAKATFLQSMSHEFRTPLNAIIGFSQVLRMPTGRDLTESQRDYVDSIEAAGKTLLDLTRGMLTMAQIDDDRIRRGMLVQSSEDVLADVYCRFRCTAEGRGIDLQIEDGTDLAFLGHEESVHAALGNLLDNALKFTSPGGRVTLDCQMVDGMVQVSVTDTGCGIPGHRHAEVFQNFNRLGHEGTGIAGAGLGLAVAHRLMQAMMGDAGFESVDGQGSTFWLRFRPPVS